jgi:cytochrome c oxidase cbb3-type subunit 3
MNNTNMKNYHTSIKKLILPAILLCVVSLNTLAQTATATQPSKSFFTTFFGDPFNYILIGFFLLILLAIYGLAKTGMGLGKMLIESKKKTTLLALLLISTASFAQTAAQPATPASTTSTMSITDAMIFVVLFSIMVFVIYSLYHANMTLIKLLYPKAAVEKESSTESITQKEREPSFLRKVYLKLVDSVPVAKEKDILLDHDYDGIHELDNNLPPWWKYGFYVTIAFAFVYMIVYHVTGTGKLQKAEYEEELRVAELQRQERMKNAAEFVTEDNVSALTEADALGQGKEIFVKNCAACHRPDGGGQVGPNLTDEFWIHGGGIKNIFKTITYGVPAKGMISWQAQLSPKQIQQVSSYILTMQGSNPTGAKEPQGDKWVDTGALQDTTATVDTAQAQAATAAIK